MTETGLFSSRGSPVVIRSRGKKRGLMKRLEIYPVKAKNMFAHVREKSTSISTLNKVIKAGKMVFHPEE